MTCDKHIQLLLSTFMGKILFVSNPYCLLMCIMFQIDKLLMPAKNEVKEVVQKPTTRRCSARQQAIAASADSQGETDQYCASLKSAELELKNVSFDFGQCASACQSVMELVNTVPEIENKHRWHSSQSQADSDNSGKASAGYHTKKQETSSSEDNAAVGRTSAKNSPFKLRSEVKSEDTADSDSEEEVCLFFFCTGKLS